MLKSLLTLTLASLSLTTFAQQAPAARKSQPVVVAAADRAARTPGAGAHTPLDLSLSALHATGFAAQLPLVRNLQDAGGYQLFVRSAERAALIERLQGAGPLTVFAPSDEAFNQLPAGLLANLWQPAQLAQLRAAIGGLIVPGALLEHDLTNGRVLTTLAGTRLTVRRLGGRVALVDALGKRAFITLSNQQASNGTVHALDAVLALP